MPNAPNHASNRKRRIVVIEDDQAFAELLTTLVGKVGLRAGRPDS